MLKRPHHAAFGSVLLLGLALLNLPDNVAIQAKLAVSSLFLPLFGLAGSVHALAAQAGNTIVPRRVLNERIDQLTKENLQLSLKAAQGEEALRENARLHQLLGWQQQSPWHLKPARVVARDTANWWRTLRIDFGKRDGARVNMPVLCPEGLVGRLSQVGYAMSEVVLVGDPKCAVAVVIAETHENGVVTASASGVLDHRLVDLTHLPRNTALKPGQTVYTSGLGGVFPAGIPVGAVVDWRSVGYGLYSEARLKLGADSSRLQEVMVMLP